MKRLFLSLILISISSLSLFGQSLDTMRYFVTSSNDTTFCMDLEFDTSPTGYLYRLKYTDMNGKTIEVKEVKNCPDVVTFHLKKYIIFTTVDRIPMKAHKPDGFVRFIKRSVDGKLKVYLQELVYRPDDIGAGKTYKFFIKMADGKFYVIKRRSDMNNYIKPVLTQCKKFMDAYSGDFSTEEEPFMEMIRLYNSLCD